VGHGRAPAAPSDFKDPGDTVNLTNPDAAQWPDLDGMPDFAINQALAAGLDDACDATAGSD
jgi:hypothetical protein